MSNWVKWTAQDVLRIAQEAEQREIRLKAAAKACFLPVVSVKEDKPEIRPEIRSAVEDKPVALAITKSEVEPQKVKEHPAPKRRRRSQERQRFLRSTEWRSLRQQVLQEMGAKCVKCGSLERIQVDHILPRSKFPHLSLTRSNLRPLCWPCNKSKAAKVETL